MALLNQYSFLLFAVGGAIALTLTMWRLKRPTHVLIRVIVLSGYGLLAVLVLAGAQFPTSTTSVDSFSQIEQTIQDGKPTFVMLYSHFCVGCIASLPSVQKLDDSLATRGQDIDVLFLDIHSDVGRVAREELGFNYTPTYILFDEMGEEVMRQNHIPSMDEITETLSERVSAGGE